MLTADHGQNPVPASSQGKKETPCRGWYPESDDPENVLAGFSTPIFRRRTEPEIHADYDDFA